MSADLEKKAAQTSPVTRVVSNGNGETFEVRSSLARGSIAESVASPEGRKLLRKIDLWYEKAVDRNLAMTDQR